MLMGARRLGLASLVWLGVLVGFSVFGGAPAGAAVIHEYLPSVSAKISEGVPAGSGAPLTGPLTGANALTVDAGGVYVAEQGAAGSGSYRLDRFDGSSGAFVAQFPQGPASLSYLYSGLAVGHSTGAGEVYVGGDESVEGETKGVVAVFSTAGVLQNVWRGTPGGGGPQSERFGCFECAGPGSVAVDDSGSLSWAAGDVYVADRAHAAVDVFKPLAGGGEEYVTRLDAGSTSGVLSGEPVSVAVNRSNDEVLIAENGVVDIFKPAAITGQYELVGSLTGTPGGSFSSIGGVTVDGGNGDIYVWESANRVVDEFSAAGEYVGRLASTPAGTFGSVLSVAVDPASHHVYVGEIKGVGVGAVDVFGEDRVIPDARTVAASSVQPTSVTLNGVVNPHNIQVSDCHFEYGTSTGYGQSVPCVPAAAGIPVDSANHAVSANVAGLTAGVLYHFRLVAGNANGTNNAQDQPVGPPVIDEESSGTPAQTMVALQAQVNPEGVDTTCRIQYVDAAHYNASAPDPYSAGASTPCTPADLGAATSDQAASAQLSGLRAGVLYHWRLVAVNASGSVSGSDRSFTTVPPVRIDSVTITGVTGTTATLHAQINPLGTDTTYRFEYGLDTTYSGGSVPVPDADIGSGSGDVAVTQQLSGLTANTTYHVRVVASNALGSERSGDHTFVYDTTGGGLPDNRAYEMVTPPQKNAAAVGSALTSALPAVAEDGSRLILVSIQCFAGGNSCTANRISQGEPFQFTRSAGGWVTKSLAPPATRFEGNSAYGYDANAGTALFTIATPPFGEDDFYARQPDGSFFDLGPTNPTAAGAHGPGSTRRLAGTADLSHLVYEPNAPYALWPFDATSRVGSGGLISSVYEYVRVGSSQPVLVGVSGGPGSTDLISACGTKLGSGRSSDGNILSADGGTVFFTAFGCASGSGVNAGVSVPAAALYARIGGSRTVLVSGRSPLDCTSATECLGSLPSNAKFEGASGDGSRVFFTSTQRLTDSASEDSNSNDSAAREGRGCSNTVGVNGCNLYVYDFSAPAGHSLVAASAGDTSGGGPRVQGVMAASGDGSRVYFVAKGVLSGAANGGGQLARDGADNLYVFERGASYPQGRVAFIAVLPSVDSEQWEAGERYANVTPDGRFLVFTSHGALTADDTSVTGAAQVFRYDALTGVLARISIGEHGFNDNGNAGTGDATIVEAQFGFWSSPVRSDPTMSHDGSFVFFQSPVALTPGALNEVRIGTNRAIPPVPLYAGNVYEWHEGHVHLISDGRDTSQFGSIPPFKNDNAGGRGSAVNLIGSDATGANVFFTTADPLVAGDTDTQIDYYDARVCTSGDPCIASASAAAGCVGEACHGTPGSAPVFGVPGSATFTGAGNPASVAGPVVKAKKKAKPRKRKARHRRRRGRGAARTGKHVKRGGK
jgi:hypothetical protein